MVEQWDTYKLRQIWQLRQDKRPEPALLKDSVDRLLRHKILVRQKKFGKIAAAWRELLPEELLDHTCLESLNGGVLKVVVDSGAHLAELNLLVREGLTDNIQQMCPGVSLRKIRLVRGTWYHRDEDGNRIPDY